MLSSTGIALGLIESTALTQYPISSAPWNGPSLGALLSTLNFPSEIWGEAPDKIESNAFWLLNWHLLRIFFMNSQEPVDWIWQNCDRSDWYGAAYSKKCFNFLRV